MSTSGNATPLRYTILHAQAPRILSYSMHKALTGVVAKAVGQFTRWGFKLQLQ
jgi:hypothetical protein